MANARKEPANAIAITPAEQRVLQLLSHLVEAYPYQLVKASKGTLRLSSIYVLLTRLEEKGVVTSRREMASIDGRFFPRRYYRLLNAQGGRENEKASQEVMEEAQTPQLIPGWAGA